MLNLLTFKIGFHLITPRALKIIQVLNGLKIG